MQIQRGFIFWKTCLLLIVSSSGWASNIREVGVTDREVVQVQLAMGHTTILEFEAEPKTAIVGDGESFQVEYSGRMVLVKPLSRDAKTNLFAIVEGRSLSVALSVGKEADYRVKIQLKAKKDGLVVKDRHLEAKAYLSRSKKYLVIYFRVPTAFTTKPRALLARAIVGTSRESFKLKSLHLRTSGGSNATRVGMAVFYAPKGLADSVEFSLNSEQFSLTERLPVLTQD